MTNDWLSSSYLDQVHVKMKYGLTRDLIVVLKYVKTVAAELFRHRHCHLSGKREHFCRDAVVDLVQIPVVIFWQDQRMPFVTGFRSRITLKSSSSYNVRDGISPFAILQNIQSSSLIA